MVNDFRKINALMHSNDIQEHKSWTAPKSIRTGDGSLYQLDIERTMSDLDSKLEYQEYLANNTNQSIKNAYEYEKAQAKIMYYENKQLVDLLIEEVTKLKSNDKFIQECFNKFDWYQDEQKSYNLMRSIIFDSWGNSMADKYSSNELKEMRRQLDSDRRTYQINIDIIYRDILGEYIEHSNMMDTVNPKDKDNIWQYKSYIRNGIDGMSYYSSIYEYGQSLETKIADEISKIYETTRNVKLPLQS